MSDLTSDTQETTEARGATAATLTFWETVSLDGTPAPDVRLAGSPGTTPTKAGAGRYQVLGEIARGGMGAVLKGRDSELNRELALKVLLEKYRDNPEVLRRFFEEAQIGGQLQHPGIVPIYDLGVFPDSRPFFAMKLVKGRTLAALLGERSSPSDDLPRFLWVFEQVAQTVAYAHSKRVIHRDLKPLNVMVGAFGEVQVMDWGLAKVLTEGAAPPSAPAEPEPEAPATQIHTARPDTDGSETSAGSRLGTPAYMAPEQARGEIDRVDERSDVFGLGAILCEILTGRPAYVGATQAEVVRKAEFADLDDALARLAGCGADAELVALARRCLHREREARPRDASEVASGVASYLAGVQDRLRKAEVARAEAAARAQVERSKRRLTLTLGGALLVAVVVGGGSFVAYHRDREARLAESERLVGEALAAAEGARAEAERDGPGATESWRRAQNAADNARATLAGLEARPELSLRVEQAIRAARLGAQAAQERTRQNANFRQLERRLSEARLLGASLRDDAQAWRVKREGYASAFGDAGLAFGRDPAPAIAASLAEADHVAEIAGFLDDWARDTSEALRGDLIAVAEAIDPAGNPLRRAVRDGDAPALERLAREDSAKPLSPEHAVILAEALSAGGKPAEAVRLLKDARSRRPDDFWLNETLGRELLVGSGPPRPPADLAAGASPTGPSASKCPDATGALRYLTAAVALRPDSPTARVNLACALELLGQLDEAERECREAIRLRPEAVAAHWKLHTILAKKGDRDGATAALREVGRLRSAGQVAGSAASRTLQSGLGGGLRASGDFFNMIGD